MGEIVDDTTNTTVTSSSLRIISHNIRYATSSPFKGEKLWPDRKPLILSELLQQTRFIDGDTASAGSFICLQEVLHDQLQDVVNGLNGSSGNNEDAKWQYIGIGRQDGKRKGEYSPILYPTRVFKLLHFENKWLSPTPWKPSKGWDAACERILTVGIFENLHTGQRLVASNTHLDHKGSISRAKSVAMILDTVQQVRRKWAHDDYELPYFIAGDFNSFPTQEAYKAMNASGQVADIYNVIPEHLHFGDYNTFTGFQPDTEKKQGKPERIDFVWLGPKKSITDELRTNLGEQGPHWVVKGYSVIPNVFDSGVFSSDHRAVVADVALAS